MISEDALARALNDLQSYLETGATLDEAIEDVSADTGYRTDVLRTRFEKAFGPADEYRSRATMREAGHRVSTLSAEFTRLIANRFAKTNLDIQHSLAEDAFRAEHASIEGDLAKLCARMEGRGLPLSWRLHVQDQFRLRWWKAAVDEAVSGTIRGNWLA